MSQELSTTNGFSVVEPMDGMEKAGLLENLRRRLVSLRIDAESLPPSLHSVVQLMRVQSYREKYWSSQRFFDFDIHPCFVHILQKHRRTDNSTTPAADEVSAESWNILEVPERAAAIYEALGFSPDDYLTCLGTQLMSAGKLSVWAMSLSPFEDSTRDWLMSGVPNPKTALEWMRELNESPDLVIISYRTFNGDLQRAKSWQLRAKAEFNPQPSGLRPTPSTYTSPLVLSNQLPVSASASAIPTASETWLEEIIARARTARPSIRKVPHWPARLELDDEETTIQLEQFPTFIKGVVTVGRERRGCEFNPVNFEIGSRCETGEDRYVVGLSICWFIDSSITTQGNSKDSTRLFAASTVGNSHDLPKRVIYTPTPTFRSRQAESRRSSARLKIRHKVSGHLRRLPPGRHGSEAARSNAPTHIRRIMADDETYVEPHFRGSEAEKAELVVRLSRYSALGDALADLDLE